MTNLTINNVSIPCQEVKLDEVGYQNLTQEIKQGGLMNARNYPEPNYTKNLFKGYNFLYVTPYGRIVVSYGHKRPKAYYQL